MRRRSRPGPIVCATPTSRRRRGGRGSPADGCAVGDPGPLPSRAAPPPGRGATTLTRESAVARRAPGILRAMRLSTLFFTTLRDDPADAEMPSHRLLVRAGYVRQLGAGLYSLLPLGFRVTKRVEQVIREEMNAIGGQELEMPVVHPAEVWKDSGRYDKIGPELVRFKDRGDRDMVLAMTHEEVIALLLRDIVQSYRQLPVQLYHFQTKFRDEPRSRGGLIRVREFVMKDAYSCDLDDAGLDVSYRQAVRRLRDGSSSASGSTRSPSVPTSGSWAVRGPRVHGPQRLRRGHPGPVRRLRVRREPADRRGREALAGGRGRPPDGGRRDPRRDDDRGPGRVPRDPAEQDRQGHVLRDRRRALRRGHRPRRLRRQRDEAGQRDQGDRRAAPRARSTRSRPGAWRRATARRSGPRDAVVVVDELITAVAEPGRRREPGRDGTCATSTSRATTRPTSSRRSRTPARATPASGAGRR